MFLLSVVASVVASASNCTSVIARDQKNYKIFLSVVASASNFLSVIASASASASASAINCLLQASTLVEDIWVALC